MNRLFQSAHEFDRDDLVMVRKYVLLTDNGMLGLAMLPVPATGAPAVEQILLSPRAWHGGALLNAEFQDVPFARGEHTKSLRLRVRESALDIEDPQQDEWGGFGGEYLEVTSGWQGIPGYLESTVAMLTGAYPGGVPSEDLHAVIRILLEKMSFNSICEALRATPTVETSFYHDVQSVAGSYVQISQETTERVETLLRAQGLDPWRAQRD